MANKDEQQTMPYPPYGYPYGAPMQQPMHPQMPPQMHMPPHMHPHYYHMQPQMPPQGYHGYHPQMMAPQPQQPKHDHFDPLMAQSQHMLEGLMGEQAGVFKDLLHKLGVDDKEFWKGAMVGAAAALILSNENVRNQLLGLLGNAGDLLKSGGEKVKSAASTTASNVTGGVAMGADVLRDAMQAGTTGFKESVARHRTPAEAADVAAPIAEEQAVAEPNHEQQ
ncbi:hypothetical protein [Ferrimonas senticii]|uniref:hypothetical protein n=1 Tax=Ferrimonas senticii TaxID=394566 RepID=UPI00041ED2D4|nr:hypothetical protein [Ferrimonas senticii]